MRVLAVAERIGQRAGDDAASGSEITDRLGEPRADGGVVGAGAGEGLSRELFAQLRRGRAAFLPHLSEKGEITGGVAPDDAVCVFLGPGADPRCPANIDVLDAG